MKIVNAHIWPRSASDHLPIFGLEVSDIHSPRNVLRLHQAIERSFNRRQVCFVQGEGGNTFILKVLDGTLRSTKLKGTSTTFADIEGKTLQTLKGNHLPFRRFLAHHAVLCYRYAREKEWIASEDLSEIEVQDKALLEHSLDEKAQQRIKYLWASRETS